MSLKILYKTLKDRISDLNHPYPEVKSKAFTRVDLFNNQTEKTKLHTSAVPAGTLPAVFIQIKESEFMHLKNNVQRRTLKFCLHISDIIFDSDGQSMITAGVEKPLEFFDKVEALHCLVNGMSIENETPNYVLFTPFVRIEDHHFVDDDKGEDSADSDFDPVYTHVITYETVQTVIAARKPKSQVNIKRVLISDVDVSNELEIKGHPNVTYVIEDGSTKNYPEERVIETGNIEPNIIVTPIDFSTSESED